MEIEKDVALCVFKGGRSMDYVFVSLFSENFSASWVCINLTVIFMDWNDILHSIDHGVDVFERQIHVMGWHKHIINLHY